MSEGEIDAMDLHRVVRELREVKRSLGASLLTLRKAGERRDLAVRRHEVLCAQVRAATDGTVQAKADAALTDRKCFEARIRAEAAKQAETYAKGCVRVLEDNQSNLQTQARLIEQALKLSGVNL